MRMLVLALWLFVRVLLLPMVTVCSLPIVLFTFCVSRRRCKMYCGDARLCVCLSVRRRTPTLLHESGVPDVTWLPPSCALLGGFAIGARVALLWQHKANPSYKLASIPRYDDSANGRLGGVRARC